MNTAVASPARLTLELAEALSLPRTCTRAVLTLEPGRFPTLLVECNMTDSKGHLMLETVREYGEPPATRIKKLQFMLRLEPFNSPTAGGRP